MPMTAAELAAQIDSLPTPIRRMQPPNPTKTKQGVTERAAKKGGKMSTIVLSPAGNGVVKWAMTTPGMPRTFTRIIDDALRMYEAHHRGGQPLAPVLDAATLAALKTMVADRPGITESQLLGLAIRHLAWSFAHSPDGRVQT